MPWNPIESPVDYFLLAGRRSPGIAVISQLASPRRWDERRGYALSGATTVFRGIQLEHFKAAIQLVTVADWNDWEDWRDLVQRPPLGTRPRALDIWHPFTEMLGVASVGVEGVSQPVETDSGIWTIEIKFIEHRRPTIALARPEGSQERPTDPVDLQIEALTQQVQELAG